MAGSPGQDHPHLPSCRSHPWAQTRDSAALRGSNSACCLHIREDVELLGAERELCCGEQHISPGIQGCCWSLCCSGAVPSHLLPSLMHKHSRARGRAGRERGASAESPGGPTGMGDQARS